MRRGYEIYAGENRILAIRHKFYEDQRGSAPLLEPEQMRMLLTQFNTYQCRPPLNAETNPAEMAEIEKLIQSVPLASAPTITEEGEPVVYEVATIREVDIPDTPDSILSGRLGEICQKQMLKHFPVAYAWPALVTAAGVQVPMSPRLDGTLLSDNDDLTNFYTALVGPAHSGKSQAIEWGAKLMGVFGTDRYLETKAGSAEGLLKDLSKLQVLADNLLINPDEWLHFFQKAGIERSSFSTVLTSGFYRRHQSLIIAGGQKIDLNYALSWIGGIVTDCYEDCFQSSSIGGLYDRFLHGLCPSGFDFDYRPFMGAPTSILPIHVAMDASVWDATSAWRKADPALGRAIEIAVRVAKVCAAYDGRPILYGKDLDHAFKTLAMDQKRIRTFLQPNAGDTPDAILSNAVLSYLDRKVSDGRWIPLRTVLKAVNSHRLRLGPGVLERALTSLSRMNEIDIVRNKTAGKRGPAGEYVRRRKD